jgi:hypothetical protein
LVNIAQNSTKSSLSQHDDYISLFFFVFSLTRYVMHLLVALPSGYCYFTHDRKI